MVPETHETILVRKGNLATLQVQMASGMEALDTPAQELPVIIDALTAQLGAAHRLTLIYRSAFGLLRQKQGRLDEAKAIYEEVLPLQEALGGGNFNMHVTRLQLEALERGETAAYPLPPDDEGS